MSMVLPKVKVIQIRRNKKKNSKDKINQVKSDKLDLVAGEFSEETEITITDIGSPNKLSCLNLQSHNIERKINLKRKNKDIEAHSFKDLEEMISSLSYNELYCPDNNLKSFNSKVKEPRCNKFHEYMLHSTLSNRIKDEQFNNEINRKYKALINSTWIEDTIIILPFHNRYSDDKFNIKQTSNLKPGDLLEIWGNHLN